MTWVVSAVSFVVQADPGQVAPVEHLGRVDVRGGVEVAQRVADAAPE
jgi:hypothetical protein